MDSSSDARFSELREWLTELDGFADSALAPASTDASFRRYFRASTAAGSFIVMDAPPPEDCDRFVRIAGLLRWMSLNAPRVLEVDRRRGFVLMTDLGTRSYLDELTADRGAACELYRDAIVALGTMQERGRASQQQLPPYDETLLRLELSIFKEWLCDRHLGFAFSASEEKAWRRTCDLLVRSALRQPQVFVHRDYHSRNLMCVQQSNPGILDFQDAVEGPLTYDLVSLLRDCYLSWPEDRVQEWVRDYRSALRGFLTEPPSEDEFMLRFDLMGVQRHLKAAGIFARLLYRDGKRGYLKDVPRTLGYIVALRSRHPELDFVAKLIDERCLPQLSEASQ